MTVRRAALALGLGLVGITVLFAVPGNGILQTNEHQLAGTLVSHLAMLMVLWGLLPTLRRLPPRLDEMSGHALGRVLAAVIVAPLAVLTAIRLAAPQATHQIITREWGVIEPLQVVLYGIALGLCRAIRAELGARDPARAVYGAGAVAMGWFMLEETDYLGALNLIVRAAGAPDGRLGRKHIGGLHDVLDAGTQTLGLVVIALGVAAVLIALWMPLGRYHAALRRELARRSAVPLAVYAAAMLLAQTIDFDDQLVAWLPGLKVLEEPLELAALLALNAALVVRLQAARREARVSTLAPGPRGSGAARR